MQEHGYKGSFESNQVRIITGKGYKFKLFCAQASGFVGAGIL